MARTREHVEHLVDIGWCRDHSRSFFSAEELK